MNALLLNTLATMGTNDAIITGAELAHGFYSMIGIAVIFIIVSYFVGCLFG